MPGSDAEPAMEEATIAGIHRAMRREDLTCSRLTRWYLDRIDAMDRAGPRLRSLITVNPRAMEQAEQSDRALRSGGILPALHGIPVVLKDNIDTRDLPTTLGSTVFSRFVPRRDAAVVERLRAAGAIILAKANLHELALSGETASSVGGQTLNPYAPSRTPGGSSGGSAAAVAANLACVGLGTDTVNSVRSPASACCLVGIKPTRGLVSRAGIAFSSLTQDAVGPLARSVADAARMLVVLTGYDERDRATAAGVPAAAGVCAAVDALLADDGKTAGALQGLGIGVIRYFFGRGGAHQPVNQLVDAGLNVLAGLGARIVEISHPFDAEELASKHAVSAFEIRRELDAYLSAQGPGAPVSSLEELIATGRCHPSLSAVLSRAMEAGPDHPEYAARMVRRLDLQETVLDLMARHNVDALAFPHQKRLVVPIGASQVERNGILAALTGFPAVVVPAGFSPEEPDAPLGVPVGLELMGRPWAEPVLLRIAAAFERATGHRRAPLIGPRGSL